MASTAHAREGSSTSSSAPPQEGSEAGYVEGYKAGYNIGFVDGKGVGYTDAKLRAHLVAETIPSLIGKQAGEKVRQAIYDAVGRPL